MDDSTKSTNGGERKPPEAVITCFFPTDKKGAVIVPLGDGAINDTYLLTRPDHPAVVLQRINPHVFPDPVRVAENVSLVTRHLEHKLRKVGGSLRFPRTVLTADGASHCLDETGAVWRMLTYVEHSVGCGTARSSARAYEGGKILGAFHHLLADFDTTRLSDPLPGFHDLLGYRAHYLKVYRNHRRPWTKELHRCCRMAESRLDEASLWRELAEKGTVAPRVIHGDPKCDNVLFDDLTGKALALVDLDTVSSGLLQYDLGDCLRSFCNPVGETPSHLESVRFEVDLCQQALTGYRDSGAPLPPAEQALIYQGIRLLTYELGLRFLTDYLDGDRYFKVTGVDGNLWRARIQFRLLESVEEQRVAIETAVASVYS